MPADNWEQRYRDQQAALTRAQQEAAEYREIVDSLKGNPDYLAAIKAVDDGEWGQTTSSRPARFSMPQSEPEEPAWARALREKVESVEKEFGGFREMTEAEQIAAARREIDQAEAKFRADHKEVPDEVYSRINQRIADTGLSFDDCARLEAFDYLAGKVQPAQPEKPAPSTFAPVGGQPPPTSQQSQPKNAEDFEKVAEARFKAKLGMT